MALNMKVSACENATADYARALDWNDSADLAWDIRAGRGSVRGNGLSNMLDTLGKLGSAHVSVYTWRVSAPRTVREALAR